MFRILVINPGSTSTKIAVYEDEVPLFVESRDHDTAKLRRSPNRQTVPGGHGAV